MKSALTVMGSAVGTQLHHHPGEHLWCVKFQPAGSVLPGNVPVQDAQNITVQERYAAPAVGRRGGMCSPAPSDRRNRQNGSGIGVPTGNHQK